MSKSAASGFAPEQSSTTATGMGRSGEEKVIKVTSAGGACLRGSTPNNAAETDTGRPPAEGIQGWPPNGPNWLTMDTLGALNRVAADTNAKCAGKSPKNTA